MPGFCQKWSNSIYFPNYTALLMTDEKQPWEENHRPYANLIFSTLSNEDALKIFELAAKGIDANGSVLDENHFSKKRYYVRLRKLVEMGLVAKENGSYVHTPLGSIVYENQVSSLKRILAKKGSLEILSDLQRRNKSDKALQSAILDLSQEVLKDVETTIGFSNLKPIKLMKTWSEFTNHVSTIAILAHAEVYIAARSIDSKIAGAALKAAEKGCIVEIIYSRIREYSTPNEMNPKTREDLLNVMDSLRAHPNVKLRRSGMLYSFFVIDKLSVAIEIPHPGVIDSFFLGVSFQSPNIAAKLEDCFDEIVKGVKIDSVVQSNSSGNSPQIK